MLTKSSEESYKNVENIFIKQVETIQLQNVIILS